MSNLFGCFLKSELELLSAPCVCIGGGATVCSVGTVGGSACGDVIRGAGGCGGGPRFVRRLGSVLPPAAEGVMIVAPEFF